MARKNLKKPIRHRNQAMYEAMQELRSSSAAQPHADSRTQRQRTRHASKQAAFRDYWAQAE